MEQAPTRLRGKASWLINKVSLHSHRLRNEGLAAVDARAYHFSILAALEEFGPASQMSIGQRCGIDRSDTHAMVNELADQGFVVRAPDTMDRRRNVITITTAGRKRLDELDELLDQVQRQLLAALSPAERKQFVALLARVLASHENP